MWILDLCFSSCHTRLAFLFVPRRSRRAGGMPTCPTHARSNGMLHAGCPRPVRAQHSAPAPSAQRRAVAARRSGMVREALRAPPQPSHPTRAHAGATLSMTAARRTACHAPVRERPEARCIARAQSREQLHRGAL
eukprot:1564848-Prymnesium_polylepis.3